MRLLPIEVASAEADHEAAFAAADVARFGWFVWIRAVTRILAAVVAVDAIAATLVTRLRRQRATLTDRAKCLTEKHRSTIRPAWMISLEFHLLPLLGGRQEGGELPGTEFEVVPRMRRTLIWRILPFLHQALYPIHERHVVGLQLTLVVRERIVLGL